ncbi:MAG: sulfite exporter TauE/SafE family protein [Lachnospiraceae bacterium]
MSNQSDRRRMDTLYVKIEGIYCDHCRETIKRNVTSLENVIQCNINGNIAQIDIANNSDEFITELVNTINESGYTTKRGWVSRTNKWKLNQILLMLLFIAFLLLIRYTVKMILGYDILNVIPQINTTLSLGAIFVIGILTSLHCVGMCGAINLVASTSKKNALIYNTGRVLCYTTEGIIVSWMGIAFSFDDKLLAGFSMIVAIVMLIVGLGMTGIISIRQISLCNINFKTRNAFLLGVINGFMPCGPLAAMQLYALSLANPLLGGLAMFLFGLGTVPLMLGFGSLQNLFTKHKMIVQKMMACFVILLAVSMIGRNASKLGFEFIGPQKDCDGYTVARIEDGRQVVSTDLGYSSYGDIAVKKGIPVTFTIHADEDFITGCNNEVTSNIFDFDVMIKEGDNVIEFTPTESGTYTYTCWMNMIKNRIYVYD